MRKTLPSLIEWRFPGKKGKHACGSHSDEEGKRPGKRPGVIKVDPRQTPRDRCDTIIHETVHEVCPYLEEWVVVELADKIERMLHADNWRRIYTHEIPK